MTTNIKLQRPDYHKANPVIASLLRDEYTVSDISKFISLLGNHGTLWLRRYRNGGSSAVSVIDLYESLEAAGGDNLIFGWVRDMAAQAFGEVEAAQDAELMKACRLQGADQWRRGLWFMLKFYEMNQGEFVKFLDGRVDGSWKRSSQFPPIRFNAIELGRWVGGEWNHKQNDAHGFLNCLLFSQLNRKRIFMSDPQIAEVAGPYATLLHHLFQYTNVWTDEDIGAWEKENAVRHSSIMCVAVSLAEQLDYIRANGPLSFHTFGRDFQVFEHMVENMLKKCMDTLHALGTNEAVHQTNSEGNKTGYHNPCDLAQLNGLLLQALCDRQLLSDDEVNAIIRNIEENLMGLYGIARYTGDVWDGRKDRYDFVRDRDEMEWCHGSPTIAAIIGKRYLRTNDPADLEWATYHFNRWLGCITPEVPATDDNAGSVGWFVPEGYRIDSATRQWTPDENIMLAWGQAMGVIALGVMKACWARKAELDATAASKAA